MPAAYSAYRFVDPVYTGFMATTAPNQSLVGRKITPRISVNNPDYIGKIIVDSHATFMGTPQNIKVVPGAPLAKMRTGDPSTVTYTCQAYGIASDGIAKIGAARSQIPEDLVNREFRALKSAVEIAEEVRYASLYQTTGNWTTTAACTALNTGIQWGSAGAQPISDLRDYINTIRKAAHNNRPNTLLIPEDVAVGIGRSAEVRNVYYLSAVGGVAAERSMGADAVISLLAKELGIAVHMVGGRYNTANFGQTHTESEIWTDTVWLGCLMADSGVDGTSVRTVATAALAVDEDSAMFGAGLSGLGHLSAGVDEIAPSQGNVWIPYVQHSSAELVVSANLGATITDCLA